MEFTIRDWNELDSLPEGKIDRIDIGMQPFTISGETYYLQNRVFFRQIRVIEDSTYFQHWLKFTNSTLRFQIEMSRVNQVLYADDKPIFRIIEFVRHITPMYTKIEKYE